MKLNVKETAQYLRGHDRYLLVTHKNPDGDTIGSAAALCLALRRAGKTAWLYENPQITEKFLPYLEGCFAPDGYEPETVTAIDVAAEDMFAKGFEGHADLCLDHHPTNPHYADDDCVRSECSSCGEIVLEVIEALNGSPTAQEADLLYIAVSTDTGCFQYANTNEATFLAAARLVKYGADNTELNVKFFRKVSRARMMLENMIYSGMTFTHGGTVAVAVITQEMLEKSGAREDDLDDLAALPGRIEGEKVGITIREKKEGGSKLSVRTTADIPANQICAAFGGGGHAMASGCSIDAPVEEAKRLILEKVDEVLG